MNTSSMEPKLEHSSTLDPSGISGRYTRPASVTSTTTSTGPVRLLMLAPFQYKYGSKSYWVTTGEWYSLDPVKDKEEIMYLDSPSNPYREFIFMEGHVGVGSAEERAEAYAYGTGYQDLVSDPPLPLRSNALLPPQDPTENPHIVETLARAGVIPAPTPVDTTVRDEVIPTLPDDVGNALPMYGDEVELPTVAEATVVESLEVSLPLTEYEVREAELRSMKVSALKSLASSMGIEYKDKDTAIKQILESK